MAKQASEWPKIIPLTMPVEAHGEPIEKLILNQPKGGDLMTLPLKAQPDGTFVMPTLELASRMAKVPPSTIEALEAIDSLEVMKVVNPFAMRCLETLGT